MNDFANEQAMSLNAARRLPELTTQNGNAISLCTMTRWWKLGILRRQERIRLEVQRRGGRLVTSREAVQRFLEQLNQPANATKETRPSRVHAQDIARANRRLDSAGI